MEMKISFLKMECDTGGNIVEGDNQQNEVQQAMQINNQQDKVQQAISENKEQRPKRRVERPTYLKDYI